MVHRWGCIDVTGDVNLSDSDFSTAIEMFEKQLQVQYISDLTFDIKKESLICKYYIIIWAKSLTEKSL